MLEGLITGFGWSHTLNVEIRGESEKGIFPLETGAKFQWSFSEDSFCIGSRPPGSTSLIPCPDKIVNNVISNQCSECANLAMMAPCLRCTGEYCRNPIRRADCVQENNHIMYLASFGYGDIKVGISRIGRRHERLQEQGALVGLICAQADGQIIRRYEATAKTLGIPDRKTVKEKLHDLDKQFDKQKLFEELEEELKLLKARMRANWYKTPEKSSNHRRLDLKLDRIPPLIHPAGVSFDGTIKGVAGQILLLDDGHQIIAIDSKQMVGRQISQEQGKSGAYQISMF